MAFADEPKAENFVAILAGEEHALELQENGAEHTHRVQLDGREHAVDAIHLEGGTWSLLIDGESYEVDVVPDPERPEKLEVSVRGVRIPLEVLDERRLRLRAVGGGLEVEGNAEVVAPMPGKVVKFLVSVGDEVAEGQGVVVVEAMKMENELKAPREGRVSALLVEQGDTVDGGVHLLVID